jgi:hypothetical protein
MSYERFPSLKNAVGLHAGERFSEELLNKLLNENCLDKQLTKEILYQHLMRNDKWNYWELLKALGYEDEQ